MRALDVIHKGLGMHGSVCDSTHLCWADRALAGCMSNLGGIWLVVGLCQTKYRAAISSRYHVPQWCESRASELVLLNENPLSESRTTAERTAGSPDIFVTQLQQWILSFFSMTLATNIIGTGMIFLLHKSIFQN